MKWFDRHIVKLAYSMLFLTLMVGVSPLIMGAYEQFTLHLNHQQLVEQVMWFPSRSRQGGVLGANYPDIVQWPSNTAAADVGPRFTWASFSATALEAVDFGYHISHQLAKTGTFYHDMHYSMDEADTGTVRMKLDIWLLEKGTILTSLNSMASATVSTAWTIDPSDLAHDYDYNFLNHDGSGSIVGGEMGQFDVSTIAQGNYQSVWHCKLTRDVDHVDDTHTGELLIERTEGHIPCITQLNSFGN